MYKRGLAVVLSVALSLGIAAMPVYAAETQNGEISMTEIPESALGEEASENAIQAESELEEIESENVIQAESETGEVLSIEEGSIEAFVARLYRTLLLREPDPKGLAEWSEVLRSRKETGADIVAGFVFSKEFVGNAYSDEKYIEVLYNAILGRQSDEEGLADWCGELQDGLSRAYVCAGFVGSQEFDKLCRSYNIETGRVKLNDVADLHPEMTKFVIRAYRLILSREPDKTGLNAWVTQLSTGKNTGTDIIRGFVESKEFIDKKLSDEDYITVLYKAVLDREPDEDGKRGWLDVMHGEGASRLAVLKGFVESVEFTKLCEFYGIKRGSITIGRTYQNPPQYYQIKDSISLSGGGYNLDIGYEGLKVVWVKKALGMGDSVGLYGAIYTNAVASRVKIFQKRAGLPQTGIVDIFTWKAMGFTEHDWFNLGAYVSPIRVNSSSTREQHIEAMIARAYDYLGTSYIIGASGAPGTGVDCSGLAMQALYAAGIDMSPINPVRHAHPGYEYESANMWASSKFKHVSYDQRQRGDLIFYQNAHGTVIHVAIYLGNDQVIESTCAPFNKVVIEPIKNAYRSNIKGVARPFV